MTARILLLAALCAAGCATTNVRGVVGNGRPVTGNRAHHVAPGGAHPLNAQADSAATRSGGGVAGRVPATTQQPAGSLRSTSPAVTAAPADSAWITFTAPRFGSYGCAPDTTMPLRGGMTVRVLRLNTVTPPFYRHGIEADSAGWDSVRAFNVPQEVARLVGRAPGERCSVRVGAGQYVVRVDGNRCPAWRVVRVGE